MTTPDDSSHGDPGEFGGIRPAILPSEPQADDEDAVCMWVMRRALLALVIVLAIATTVCIVWQLVKAAQ